ncbi:GAF domain-containing protein [Staphylococcus sp. EG-SA-6]|jgi:L-methionine (R)-S-oxide reductase|uniref:Free methionine-(R)-sulfoxide reductase n=4 Tax=Staphylococcus haemolyticus TaxID=1283 RepID=A0A2A1KA99_STAHA|nr:MULTISPECIES: GAF domain-containing protein [Staphylococcus]KDP54525.1 GAF domain protein [Staphylococcus aureus subsp. aureus CO-98]MBN4935486.1 GAF domain-containing protein [Staphylococcus sp. EG-SA-6]MDU2098770.1 GAF domain-containing protein [Staphylococcus sp.]AKC75955.1 GAF domain-containing protein [Staphylococcus haemolyticus]AMW23645.1 Free methionine-(R)-sulfoxide reductase [Staphylococcus haemolyticus]
MPLIKETNYNLLTKQLQSLIEDEQNLIAILSNTSAILNDNLDQINWVGFYLIENEELILGPFQGHPACVHIAIGKGVCGTAVAEDKTQLVKDVHAFPGHIACDANSKSEIVIPIHVNDEIIGVLDIDAPITDRFTNEDKEGLEVIVKVIEKQLTK